jgi:hypothetical protein
MADSRIGRSLGLFCALPTVLPEFFSLKNGQIG